MITFKAKTDTGEKITISAKSSWDEITYEELLEIEYSKESLSPLKLFTVLTGTNYDVLANSPDPGLMETLAVVTKFIYNEPDWENLKRPERLLLGGRLYKTPDDLNKLAFGQRLMLTQLAGEKGTTEIFHKVVAIIMLPIIHGKFTKESEEKLQEVEKLVLESNAIETYAAGQFFFRHSELIRSIGIHCLNQSQQSKMNTKVLEY